MPPVIDCLDSLVPVLLDVASRRPPGSPAVAVAVRDVDEEGGELMLRDLPGGPPPLRLLELDPDPEWHAVGLLGTGRAFSTDPDAPPAGPTPVHGVTLVDRLGGIHGAFRGEGIEIDTPPSEGLVVDALFRLLGLPTAPPPTSVSQAVLRFWLTGVIEVARARHLTWRAAARLYAEAIGDPAEVTGTHASGGRLDWADVLREARARPVAAFDLTGAVARRHDEGSLARWILRDVPALDHLLTELDAVVSPSVARRIRAVVGPTEG